MLEYGIKTITTNPTLITKTNEIVKIIDNKTKKIRAFVLPSRYEDIVNEIIKEEEYRLWAKKKKEALNEKTKLDEKLMKEGIKNINEYLGDFDETR